MVPDIQKIPTTTAVIASPSILAATFRALTSFPLFAFINVCKDEAGVQRHIFICLLRITMKLL